MGDTLAANSQKSIEKANLLHWGRFLVAVFAILVAAAHLAFTIPLSAASFQAPHTTNTTTTTHPPSGGFGSFNELGFWFDLEVIAYTIIAVIFLFGLRTWYWPAVGFNIFNLGIYFISGVVAIPGITSMASPGRFSLMAGLSSINIIIIGWVFVLILGLLLLKYDPGSELDKLLVTRKS